MDINPVYHGATLKKDIDVQIRDWFHLSAAVM
jgi:hypothetical protein